MYEEALVSWLRPWTGCRRASKGKLNNHEQFPSSKSSFFRLIALLITVMACSQAQAAAVKPVYDPQLYQSLEWRNIGPFRGGRVTAVAGHADQIFTFYFGATGGGVWKTENGGVSWNNISDGYFATGTIGGIAVAPSDPNVVYVGTGESPIRGVSTSHGDGVYKSTDGGATWTQSAWKNQPDRQGRGGSKRCQYRLCGGPGQSLGGNCGTGYLSQHRRWQYLETGAVRG